MSENLNKTPDTSRKAAARKKTARPKKKKPARVAFVRLRAGAGRAFAPVREKWNRLNEVNRVLVSAALGGVALALLLCALIALRPGMDSRRAVSAANEGDVKQAVRLVRKLERGGYPADKLDDTRIAVVAGFIEAGEIDEALTLTPDIADAAAREEMELRCGYARALSEYRSGRYSEAAQRFYRLGDYSDSAARYDECRCALAITAYLSGDEAAARSLLLDVRNVVERVEAAAIQVAGSKEEAGAILSAGFFDADSLARMEHTMTGLKEARSSMPEGRVAAGSRHTVGLRADGTVIAAGDDSKGQCAVSDWTGITHLAAGAFHTVGLRADGTCVAAGDNSCGQTDVSGWSDIVAIAAGSYSTVGLRADGSVVACGMHADRVTGWRDVTSVAAGGYSMGCIYGSGMMMSSHGGAQMDMSAVLYDFSICSQVSAGVLYDGTMVSSFEGAPEWTEIAAVTVFEAGILAIDVDGNVRGHFFRPGDALDLSVPAPAVEAASGGTHHVILTEDGRVYGFGSNDYGQCELQDWQL